eukprot:1151860-Pelagomonas_calceolata.AAC.3
MGPIGGERGEGGEFLGPPSGQFNRIANTSGGPVLLESKSVPHAHGCRPQGEGSLWTCKPVVGVWKGRYLAMLARLHNTLILIRL